MCQTQHSRFNVGSLIMHPGLITGWIAPVTIVDSAPRRRKLIAKRLAGPLGRSARCISILLHHHLLCVFLMATLRSLLFFVFKYKQA